MSINSKLPHHIIQSIISKLPVLALPASRLTCKVWNHMILDYASTCKFVPNAFFVFTRSVNMVSYNLTMHCVDLNSKHLDLSDVSFRFDSNWFHIRILNSCNGLLCIKITTDMKKNCVGILNPMTNEYFKLSEDDCSFQIREYGFGFNLKTKQYKVTRFSFDKEINDFILEISTLNGSNKWSRIKLCNSSIFYSNCVYFNGALYWIGEGQTMTILVRLDVEDEELEEISLPKVDYSYNNVRIGVCNGNLHVIFSLDEYYKFEVWTMRNNEEKDLWNREFFVDGIPEDWVLRSRGKHLQLIKTCEDGEILCLVNRFYLFKYNPKTRRMKKLRQNDENKKSVWVQIESVNFNSLEKILAGNG